MTQRLTLTDGAGNVLAQVEGDEPELVHDLPAGDYTLEAEQLPRVPMPDYGNIEPDLAPDGTRWATYLGDALGAYLADPLHQLAPWGQWRAWDSAGRPD